jgi:hypothetical protein
VLTSVTVDCGDGAPLSPAVDLTTLSSLQTSIQGIVDNPSGLSCSLTQQAVMDPLVTSNSGGFVVGGGRYDRDVCPLNFGLSAHMDSGGVAHGTQTLTANNSNQGCGGTGHVKANVTCVQISLNGQDAEIRGDILEQTGSLGPQFFPPGNTVLATDVHDSGNPSNGQPDTIIQSVEPTGTDMNCQVGSIYLLPGGYPPFPVDNGNITVHS